MSGPVLQVATVALKEVGKQVNHKLKDQGVDVGAIANKMSSNVTTAFTSPVKVANGIHPNETSSSTGSGTTIRPSNGNLHQRNIVKNGEESIQLRDISKKLDLQTTQDTKSQ